MSKEFKDNTIEISDKVKKIIRKKYRLYRRLVHAFPRIKENVLYNRWDEMKKRIEESKQEIAIKIDNSKEEIKNKIDNSKAEIRGMLDSSKHSFHKLSRKKNESK